MGFVTYFKRDNDTFCRLGPSLKDSHYFVVKEGRFFKENNVWYLYFVTANNIDAKYKPGKDDENAKWESFTVPAESLCRVSFDPIKVPPYKELTFNPENIYAGVFKFDPNVLEHEKNTFLQQSFGSLVPVTNEPSELLKNVTHVPNSNNGGKGKKDWGGNKSDNAPKQTEYEILQDRKKWVLEQYREFVSLTNDKFTDEVREVILKSEDILVLVSNFDCDYWGFPSNDKADSHPTDLVTVKRLFDEIMALILGRNLSSPAVKKPDVNAIPTKVIESNKSPETIAF